MAHILVNEQKLLLVKFLFKLLRSQNRAFAAACLQYLENGYTLPSKSAENYLWACIGICQRFAQRNV